MLDFLRAVWFLAWWSAAVIVQPALQAVSLKRLVRLGYLTPDDLEPYRRVQKQESFHVLAKHVWAVT